MSYRFVDVEQDQDGPARGNLAGSLRFCIPTYERWNFNSGNYLFTTDTK